MEELLKKIDYFKNWLILKKKATDVYGEEEEVYLLDEILDKFSETFGK